MGSWTYDELIGEFVALGGEVENARYGSGPRGAGLFVIDPDKPVKVRIPPSLLTMRDHLSLEDGAVRIAPESPLGTRERAFVARYYQDFCWPPAAPGIEAQMAAFQALPAVIANALGKDLGLPQLLPRIVGTRPFARFLQSRAIRVDDTPVMMPVVDLVNHDAAGVRYATSDGIAVAGSFADELLVRYRPTDAFGIFEGWGFVCSQPFAYSLPLMFAWRGRVVGIDRFVHKAPRPSHGIVVEGKLTVVSRLLIGDRIKPERPEAVLAKRLAAAGITETGGLLAEVRALNRAKLEAFAALVTTVQGEAARQLERVCTDQLDALGARRD